MKLAGRVAAVGSGVTRFAEGDGVVVANSAPCLACEPCRRGRENLCEDLHYLNGAFADYLLVPSRFVERNTHAVPAASASSAPPSPNPLPASFTASMPAISTGTAPAVPPKSPLFGAGPIGLLFVAALAIDGHRVILADPNPGRLEVAPRSARQDRGHCPGRRSGGGGARRDGGGQRRLDRGRCLGVPEVWLDAIQCVRPGGLVNLFGGWCAGHLDSPRHPSHPLFGDHGQRGLPPSPRHLPAGPRSLGDPAFKADLLLSGTRPVAEVEDALRAMMRKDALKMVISNAADRS